MTDDSLPPEPRRHGSRVWWVGGTVVLVLVLASGGAVWFIMRNDASTGNSAATPVPPATAVVKRQDLAATVTVNGTLGYGTAKDAGGPAGIITWLPDEGATVSRGARLFSVDNQPVTLMYGSLPLYRTLREGVDDGRDVHELEDNLTRLGYGGFTVDDTYTSATADAVRSWQYDHNMPETGVVQPGQVVMAPGAVRIGTVKKQVGGRTAAGATVLQYSDDTRVVSIGLDVADQQMVVQNRKVTVDLPDNRTVAGTITKIGTVAHAPTSTTGSGPAQDPTVDVTVSIDKPTGAGNLDGAPVQVDIVSERRAGVLAVPVAALLALREGGYGLQLLKGQSTQLVPVKVGLFANGLVEVSGPGVTTGAVVGMPKI